MSSHHRVGTTLVEYALLTAGVALAAVSVTLKLSALIDAHFTALVTAFAR